MNTTTFFLRFCYYLFIATEIGAMTPAAPIPIESKLPISLPYKEVVDSVNAKILLQNEYANLQPEDTQLFLVTYPLKPCIGVVFIHAKGVSLLHYSQDINLDHVATLVNYLQLTKSQTEEIKIKFYTVLKEDFSTSMFARVYKKDSQLEVIEHLKSFFIANFAIAENSFETFIHHHPQQDDAQSIENYYWWSDIASCLVVDRNGTIFNTSAVGNGLLPILVEGYHQLEKEQKRRAFDQLHPQAFSRRNNDAYAGLDMHALGIYLGQRHPIVDFRDRPHERWPSIINRDPVIAIAKSKSCAKCGATKDLKQCNRCKSVKYCSRVCQKADWRIHKKSCKAPEEH